MVAIDLFAGAGGMSLGARMAGVKVMLAIDVDSRATSTYAHNLPETAVVTAKIQDIDALSVPSTGEKLVVFGGPPCQGFSVSNQRTRSTKNEANWLFSEFIRVVEFLSPDWVVFENVTGIRQTESGFFLDIVRAEFLRLGYALEMWELNAVDFGVPQNRRRLFVVGNAQGMRVPAPVPIPGRAVTVRQAIADLPLLANGASNDVLPYRSGASSEYAACLRGQMSACSNHLVTMSRPAIIARYRYVPQGGNWEHVPRRLMDNYADPQRCHTGIYRRLRSNAPSTVIGNFRKNMLIHPTQHRGLSVREAARLQSFPDWFVFRGSIGFQQQQVGNAVPPLLAKAVFDQVQEHANGCPKDRR